MTLSLSGGSSKRRKWSSGRGHSAGRRSALIARMELPRGAEPRPGGAGASKPCPGQQNRHPRLSRWDTPPPPAPATGTTCWTIPPALLAPPGPPRTPRPPCGVGGFGEACGHVRRPRKRKTPKSHIRSVHFGCRPRCGTPYSPLPRDSRIDPIIERREIP